MKINKKIQPSMVLILLCLGLVFSLQSRAGETTRVFMAGDSTMSIKPVAAWPETGWGMPFSILFDDTVQVDNRAMNGRSTRTFISEGRWGAIVENLQPGDYVFIQFGHNDQSSHKPDRYTPPADFAANLTRFISDVRTKKAEAVLLTPISRRYFSEDGSIKPTHPVYADLVREVAKKTDVVFIDMEAISRQYLSALGDSHSKLRFMHLAPGVHPNYPRGVTDDTHLNELGAREVAQQVLAELKRQGHPLASRLRPPRYARDAANP